MRGFDRLLNSRGETFIELLIATFILGVTLAVVISVFMSGREAIVTSWDRTEENLCAIDMMEQLKVTDYETIMGLSGNGWNNFSATTLAIDEKYSSYHIQFSISSYKDYLVKDLVQVNVRVRRGSERTWVEKASLIHKGDSS